MIICPNCKHENEDHEQICVRCGTPLVDVVKQTVSLGDTDYEEGVPKWGSARIRPQMDLLLEVLESKETFVFDADKIEEVVLGRTDPDTGQAVEVDLTRSDGVNKGVSRRHAMLVRRNDALHIVDNNSANGTFLNGQRLVAQQPRILRDGDDIRLGHMVIRITFKIASQ